MRTIARESVFKIIFAKQFDKEQAKELERTCYHADKLDEKDVAYCQSVLACVEEHYDELIALIDSKSYSFPESGLFPADKSILLVALAEICYFDDIPSKVSVNEAANIASKYSSEKSATFISGVLSSIIADQNNG